MNMLFDFKEDGHGKEVIVPSATLVDTPPDEEQEEVVGEEWFEESPEPTFNLRPYQVDAVTRIEEELYGKPAIGDEPAIEPKRSTLAVMATGLGKTALVSEVIRRRKPGKALMIAHRYELVMQAKTTLEALCGEPVTVDMAERYAHPDINIVVATVQTLTSSGNARLMAHDPSDYSVVVQDEAHHSTADVWMRVYKHFQQNPKCKVVGLTATPDRADEEALGKVFESVAITYEIADAIRDGWLVPIEAIPVHVSGLDLSSVRTTAGDLNGKDLAQVMEAEQPLHEMVQGVIEVVCGAPQDTLRPMLAIEDETAFQAKMGEFTSTYPLRKTLIFAASVAHAERLSEIINRWLPGKACWVCGKTPKDERIQLFADYKAGRYMFLINVGITTEGWDEPTVEVVVMARPTKSRALYTQMLGRGTRALPGVVDGPETPEDRRRAIADSGKPKVVCVDLVGNCGKHSLMTPADILGGNYTDEVISRAKAMSQRIDRRPANMEELLERARQEEEDEAAREAAKRAKIRVGASYVIGKAIDPFKMFHVVPQRERGWETNKPVTAGMKAALERQKLWDDKMTYSTARQLCQGMAERRKKGLCTFRQARQLVKAGLPSEVSFDTAKSWMDRIAANHWQAPSDVKAEAAAMAMRGKGK